MGPQRFTAKNAAEALKQVRQALGPDAMVLSTRESDEGVEILAITPDGLDEVSQTVARSGSSLQASRSTPSASLASAAEKRGIEQVTQAMDEYRGESFADTFPELNQLMESAGEGLA